MLPLSASLGEAESLARSTGLDVSLARPLLACAVDDMPANIALMQLCMAADEAASVEAAISAGEDLWGTAVPPLTELRALWDATPEAFHLVKRILMSVDDRHGPGALEEQLAECAAGFDEAAALSPEASVALYSLGQARAACRSHTRDRRDNAQMGPAWRAEGSAGNRLRQWPLPRSACTLAARPLPASTSPPR